MSELCARAHCLHVLPSSPVCSSNAASPAALSIWRGWAQSLHGLPGPYARLCSTAVLSMVLTYAVVQCCRLRLPCALLVLLPIITNYLYSTRLCMSINCGTVRWQHDTATCHSRSMQEERAWCYRGASSSHDCAVFCCWVLCSFKSFCAPVWRTCAGWSVPVRLAPTGMWAMDGNEIFVDVVYMNAFAHAHTHAYSMCCDMLCWPPPTCACVAPTFRNSTSRCVPPCGDC